MAMCILLLHYVTMYGMSRPSWKSKVEYNVSIPSSDVRFIVGAMPVEKEYNDYFIITGEVHPNTRRKQVLKCNVNIIDNMRSVSICNS